MAQASFFGMTSIEPTRPNTKYCPRCARPATQVTSSTHEIWNCINGHGEIFRAELPKLEEKPEEAPAEEPDPAA